MPAGCSSGLPASHLHAPELQGEGPPAGDCGVMEPLGVNGIGTVRISSASEPGQNVTRAGRTVRQPVHFKDFVSR